ncbi:MAG TPA: hypothetical protein EYP85_02165 [Armatimonadetes bacterium]|nr:hypothetical protein [Armatimonadota bacterium]
MAEQDKKQTDRTTSGPEDAQTPRPQDAKTSTRPHLNRSDSDRLQTLGLPAAVAGALALLVAGSVYLITNVLTKWLIALLAGGGVLLLFALLAFRREIAACARRRGMKYTVNATVVVISVLGILVLLNYISYRHLRWRYDMTENKRYSLSEQTIKILKGLKKEVHIIAFYPPDNVTPTEYRYMRDLLTEYDERSPKLKVEVVDPDVKPALARKYNLTYYPKIVIECGDRQEQISRADEADLTSSILKVSRDQKPKVYFLTGHGERDIEGFQDGFNTVKRMLEHYNYEVTTLSLLKEAKVPDECNVLVIAGPTTPLKEEEVEAIQTYLENGGSLLAMVDPPPSGADVNAVISRWGLETPDEVVYDEGLNLQMQAAIPVVEKYTSHEVTKRLPATFYLEARPVVQNYNNSDMTITELAKTTANSYTKPAKATLLPPPAEGEEVTSTEEESSGPERQGPVSLVSLAVTREPAPGPEEKEEEEEKKPKTRLIVVGDSDFATNNFIRLLGNANLVLNAIGWLAEEEELIAIKPKEADVRELSLTSRQMRLMTLVTLLFTPAFIIAIGVGVYIKRR